MVAAGSNRESSLSLLPPPAAKDRQDDGELSHPGIKHAANLTTGRGEGARQGGGGENETRVK